MLEMDKIQLFQAENPVERFLKDPQVLAPKEGEEVRNSKKPPNSLKKKIKIQFRVSFLLFADTFTLSSILIMRLLLS